MRKLSTALKIVVSAAILLFLFRKANLSQGLQYLEEIRPSYLIFAVVLIVAGQVVRAQRLVALLFGSDAQRGIDKLARVLRIQMISFLPGIISPAKVGEVSKVFMLKSEMDVPTERGLVCFVAERVYDLLLLSPLAAAGLFVFYRAGLDVRIEEGWIRLIAFAMIVFCAASVAGVLFANKKGISLSSLRRAVSPAGMLKAAGWTLVYWSIVFLEVWCFMKASAFDARIAHAALVVPPSLLSSLIPITVSGFGIRELAMTMLLQRPPVGAAYEQALVVSLMYDIIGLGVPALMGALYWVTRKKNGASQN